MSKKNYTVARVVTHTKDNISKFERHNERKNKTYSNMNIDLTQTPNNVYFKRCDMTLNQKLNEIIKNGQVSLRGLKDNAKVFDELVFDVNSNYFEENGGYEFAKKFYEQAFHFAEQEMGAENIISAVMHADELNVALTEEYGKPIYHYHLHVIAIPVVKKEIKYSKRVKDKSLIGKTKEIINQVSHSKKWKSQQATDYQGNLIYDKEGKPVLIKSYSLLQDRFFQYMSDSGFKDFIRGIKGSTAEHLETLDFKIKKDKEKLENIEKSIKEREVKFDEYIQYDNKIENVENLGKAKKFSKNIELKPQEYQDLLGYAKKGVVADKKIFSLNNTIENLKNTVQQWKSKYEEIVEQTKDYFHAIKLAPQKVFDLFRGIFDKEKRDELERERIAKEKAEAQRKAYEETREKERLARLNFNNSPQNKKRRADRDAR